MVNAVKFMTQALELAEKIGDTSGARIHTSNLETCRPGGAKAGDAAASTTSAGGDTASPRGAGSSGPRERSRGGFGEFGASSSLVIRERLRTAHEDGKNAYTRGERREAITIWEQCLKDSRTIRHEESEGAVLGNLGMAYESIGEHTVALHHLKNALRIVEKTGDRNGLTNHLLNLAGSHASLKDYDLSIECQRKALTVFESDGNLRSQEGVYGYVTRVGGEGGPTR
jgi:tetratricopeptide (TPR) repeat protein